MLRPVYKGAPSFIPPPPFLFLLPACLGRFCLCIAVISHGWLGLSPVTEQVEDSCCEKALHLMFYEWMGGRISGTRPLLSGSPRPIARSRRRGTCQAAFGKRVVVFRWGDVGKFCRLFASPSEPIAQVLSLLPFLSSPWLQLVGFSAFPIVRTCVSRFAAVFVVGRDARILVLTFDGGTCCCFAHSHYCKKKKKKLKWRCWCKSMREEWEPAKVLIHCQSL